MTTAREAIARALLDVNLPALVDRLQDNPNATWAEIRVSQTDSIFRALKQAGYRIVPGEATEAMLIGARDWSKKRYGIGVGNDDATGCYRAMLTAHEDSE